MGKPTGNADKCTKDSSKGKYSRKRKYSGNQYSNKKTVEVDSDTTTTKACRDEKVL